MGWLDDIVSDTEEAATEARSRVTGQLETLWEGDVPPPPAGMSPEDAAALRERLIRDGADPGAGGRIEDAADAPARLAGRVDGLMDRAASMGRWMLIGAFVVALLLIGLFALWLWSSVKTISAVAPAVAAAMRPA